MSKEAPTLADSVIREYLNPLYKTYGLDPDGWVVKSIAGARKFVLDDSMSAFMADLAYASVLTCKTPAKAQILLEGMRMSARVPHPLMWIEYNNHAKGKRAFEEYNAKVGAFSEFPGRDKVDTPDRCGWLVMHHPKIDTAFLAIEFASHSWDTSKTLRTSVPTPSALAWAWCANDEQPPWPLVVERTMTNHLQHCPPMPIEAFLVGVPSYQNPNVVATNPPFVSPEMAKKLSRAGRYALREELAADLRYLWALLATINRLPVLTRDVKSSKGFVARGKYRKFVDHKVLTLSVPTTRYRRIAAQAIAMARRRAHQVRGHWRKDWRNPLSPLCDHVWEGADESMYCKVCDGRRLWVKNHERGDASLGFVTHDYKVTHGD